MRAIHVFTFSEVSVCHKIDLHLLLTLPVVVNRQKLSEHTPVKGNHMRPRIHVLFMKSVTQRNGLPTFLPFQAVNDEINFSADKEDNNINFLGKSSFLSPYQCRLVPALVIELPISPLRKVEKTSLAVATE